ncbi:helix-turn-helix transcriptional regulator [Actinoplanes sp. CA-030573]|uniref:helix-turn-helix transcriptional regulator n=1 Tax=Actinoplanes sp. CA-030573 TaxID=3239898 RepID=UPI003D8C6751
MDDARQQLREFLMTRRARITPEQAGLPRMNASRRVPGLRREELASLAGVSISYYVRLERGDASGASDSVLEAIARALQLDDAERRHLFTLAHAGAGTRPQRVPRPVAQQLRPSVQLFLDAITDAPVVVGNHRADIIGANRLGYALFSPMWGIDDPSTMTERPPAVNGARFMFLDPAAQRFYPQWEQSADQMVAILRVAATDHPYDKQLSALVGDLAVQSDDFRIRWAEHNVREHRTGPKTLHHPIVGDITLTYEVMTLAADPGLTMTSYCAAPHTPDAEALRLLASWSTRLLQR